MGLLSGKTALVFGIANDHSIAWGIARAFAREGARTGFSCAGPRWKTRVDGCVIPELALFQGDRFFSKPKRK
jgi:enoyl-[acyl-carrier-protein] reductase (NADH)